MKTITKAQYLEILQGQIGHFRGVGEPAKKDLETLLSAYEDLEKRDFERVEVIQENGSVAFNIIED